MISVSARPTTRLKPEEEIRARLTGKLPPELVTRLSAKFGGRDADIRSLGPELRRELENAGFRADEGALRVILGLLLGNLPDVETAMIPVEEYFGSLEE